MRKAHPINDDPIARDRLIAKLQHATGLSFWSVYGHILKNTAPKNPVTAKKWLAIMDAKGKA